MRGYLFGYFTSSKLPWCFLWLSLLLLNVTCIPTYNMKKKMFFFFVFILNYYYFQFGMMLLCVLIQFNKRIVTMEKNFFFRSQMEKMFGIDPKCVGVVFSNSWRRKQQRTVVVNDGNRWTTEGKEITLLTCTLHFRARMSPEDLPSIHKKCLFFFAFYSWNHFFFKDFFFCLPSFFEKNNWGLNVHIQFIFKMNKVLSRKFLFSIDNPNVFGVILRFIYHFDVLAIDLFFFQMKLVRNLIDLRDEIHLWL
jgi:hypothetical protein